MCSANELQQASAACAQAGSAGCQAYFNFERQVNPACAKCLTPFDVPFTDLSGIFTCAAPFVDATCNHDSACFTDCENQSCAKCPAGGVAACQADVQNNQCASFVNDLDCVFNSVFGGGAATFCNPQNYPSFGGWLQGVGGHYCGP